ncbi:MAG: DUF4349 domain-containing protein [Chloroflexi bacterium]|nr:DUF4349 domain-containing protein [Chloroflexota bacterium]
MTFLLVVLACSANESFPEEVLASKSIADQDDGGFSRVVAEAAASMPAAAEREVILEREVIKEVVKTAGTGSSGESSQDLEAADRKVISTAFLSMEVDLVDAAMVQIRDIAVNLGGFLENLNSSGVEGEQYANMTVRVPQAQFALAVERIELVGKVQSKNLGSEDVSERFIDLQARLKSSLREEESLLSLLGRTSTVSEVLAIERELTRVRSSIERFQGQLNFLERRIDLATITVSLVSPEKRSGEPPSASMRIEVNGVTDHVDAVKSLVASSNGVVDSVLVSLRNGKESAVMTVHVFSDDFNSTVGFLEDQGRVRSKDVQEGKPGEDGAASPEEKPMARIDLTFVEDSNSVNIGLMVAIAAPIGALALGVILGIGFFGVYRRGGRTS